MQDKSALHRKARLPQTFSLTTDKVQFIDVDESSQGQRLDNFLLRELKGVPRSLIYRLIRTDEVRVNKKRVKVTTRLSAGDSVRVAPIRQAKPKTNDFGEANNQLEQRILYEDEQLIVLDKPSGWAVHGGSGIAFGVIEHMRQNRPEFKFLELAHRLDRETSGCLILAKKRSCLLELQKLIRAGAMQKHYNALVIGKWPKSLQRVEVPLQKNVLQSGERVVKVSDNGKPSTTLFRRLKVIENLSLDSTKSVANEPFILSWLDIELLTGRTHQIRVHCKHSGFPILGDAKYGIESINKAAKAIGLNRLCLHARKLQFQLEGKPPVVIDAPIPSELSIIRDD